jgi:hypothetical protein
MVECLRWFRSAALASACVVAFALQFGNTAYAQSELIVDQSQTTSGQEFIATLASMEAATTTSLSSSLNPSFVVGTPVTFTAAVAPVSGGATPTGTITFNDGTTPIGSGVLDAGGVATLVTSALTPGAHGIRAAYSGDATYVSSTSEVVYQVISVNPACIGNIATNASLVEHYYQAILRRPSDAPGKAFWNSEADRLCALGADPKAVFAVMASAFFNSTEYVGFDRDDNGFISDLYDASFSRQADWEGASYWLSQLFAGMPTDTVMSWFLFSPEFTETMNVAFPGQTARAETYLVLNLYGGLFRRLADTGGYTYWTEQFRTAQCDANPATAVRNVINGASSSFVGGAEYIAQSTTDSEYVVDLYYALLHRGAEPDGYNFWVLNAVSRESAWRAFVASPEMQVQIEAIAAQGCLQ